MNTWQSEVPPPPEVAPGWVGWLRVVIKAVPLAIVVFGGLAVLLILRLVERPIFGLRRPATPFVTQGVCRTALVIVGLRLSVEGPRCSGGPIVANHVSWLDIFVLNAARRVYFVSKSEVAGWLGIGWLARATGTVFIERDRRLAAAQRDLLMERVRIGHLLALFPEGTSTDGKRILPFKSTLFDAFLNGEGAESIQPVTLAYHATDGEDDRFYGWWGDMEFGAHLIKVLAAPRGGRVEAVFHEPMVTNEFASRKALAKAAEEVVREGLARRLPQPIAAESTSRAAAGSS
ncbi:lysophospholipid acyltransferase family protein [Aestuariibius sp. 2305UL40-4]|uniref:lysophospholipid acyltransferase family protein n=1 Tax=Aestuariibius violaceus TaxID=3234132 RepID=UPI00345E1B0C